MEESYITLLFGFPFFLEERKTRLSLFILETIFHIYHKIALPQASVMLAKSGHNSSSS